MRRLTIALTFACCCLPFAAAAQTSDLPFVVIGQLTGVTSSEFDGTPIGFGGVLGWRPEALMTLEAETNFYPSELTAKNGSAFSRGSIEALFGVTAGPTLDRVRPFGTFRTGVVQIRRAPGPLACITIFPPTLPCSLAKGEAVLASEIGGGIELLPSRRALLRVELGDRLMHYPGPAIDAGGSAHNMSFYKSEFRFTVGAGLRF
jgi:hypothetical protein